MKNIYIITWRYHNNNDSSYDDGGVVEQGFTDEKEAQDYLLVCAKGELVEMDEACKPKLTHEPDYAKVEDMNEYYEYKIAKVYIDVPVKED